jgi:hypothetical protein
MCIVMLAYDGYYCRWQQLLLNVHVCCCHLPQLAVLSSLSHPNIVRCYGTAREGPSLLIFLEYVPVSSSHSCLAQQCHSRMAAHSLCSCDKTRAAASYRLCTTLYCKRRRHQMFAICCLLAAVEQCLLSRKPASNSRLLSLIDHAGWLSCLAGGQVWAFG